MTYDGGLDVSLEQPSACVIDARASLTKPPTNGTLKTYRGLPYDMPTTEADTINAGLLACIEA